MKLSDQRLDELIFFFGSSAPTPGTFMMDEVAAGLSELAALRSLLAQAGEALDRSLEAIEYISKRVRFDRDREPTFAQAMDDLRRARTTSTQIKEATNGS